MKKNPHDKILKGEPKEQHLSIVPKSCHFKKNLIPTFMKNIKSYKKVNYLFLLP